MRAARAGGCSVSGDVLAADLSRSDKTTTGRTRTLLSYMTTKGRNFDGSTQFFRLTHIFNALVPIFGSDYRSSTSGAASTLCQRVRLTHPPVRLTHPPVRLTHPRDREPKLKVRQSPGPGTPWLDPQAPRLNLVSTHAHHLFSVCSSWQRMMYSSFGLQ